MTWPVVIENDFGIRPAGPPDACFYCNQKIGQPHGRDCVVVEKRVLYKVHAGEATGTVEVDEPHHWDAEQCEYRYNEGTWCGSNIVDYPVQWDRPGVLEALMAIEREKGGCLCGEIRFQFIRVVDDTPRVPKRESQ